MLLAHNFAQGQTVLPGVTNSSLSGTYFFRQLEFSTDTQGNVTGSVASLGRLVFDGRGRFTVDGFQTVGTQAATPLSGSGAYAVQPSGVMTLSNPQRNGYILNARFATELILGSTTESADNSFDLFAAIPAPTVGQVSGLFQGTYNSVTFELQNSITAGIRSTIFNLPVTASSIAAFPVLGHAASLQNGAALAQTVAGSSFALGNDGAGTISFGGNSSLLSGTKNFYVSASGNVVLGGSPYAGAQDFLIGFRQFSGRPTAQSITGLYWTAGIRLDLAHQSTAAYAGSLNGIPAKSQVVTAQRLHQIGLSPGFEVTLSNPIQLNSDATLGYGLDVLTLGSAANAFVAGDFSTVDTGGYSVDIGVRAPAFAGSGVFLNPQGIVSAAGLSPAGAAVAPGELITLFGSGLADTAAGANLPYPFALNGTSVTVNGLAAPIAYISGSQINVIVPYAVSGATASLIVTNNGSASNTVTVPLQKTAPGVFSADGSGTGPGAITHAAGSLVTAQNPARRGETIVVYATGLGAVTPPATDGLPASGTSANAVSVTIAGQTASVTFAGLSPAYPGLYQINVGIPANLVGIGALPLAIRTIDAFHCQVDLQVQ